MRQTILWGVVVVLCLAGSRGVIAAEAEAPESQQQIPVVAVAEAATAATPAVKAPASANRLIEEIIITAQKRDENLQDVPISVQAFSGEQLSAVGIENTKDLNRITPGLQFTEMAGYTLVYLRGIGTDAFLATADPSVATYIDGLYIPALHGLINSFGGVERVEVLKGPQGTLFGRNATAGAVAVITKSPGNAFEFSTETELGNLSSRKAQAYLNVPLSDSLAINVSGVYRHMDTYYENVSRGLAAPAYTEFPDDRSLGGRVKLRWTPTDDLDFMLTAYHLEQQGAGSTLASLKYPSQGLGLIPRPDQTPDRDYEVSVDRDLLLEVESDTVLGNVKWTLPWFDLKLLYGDQRFETTSAVYDYDGSPLPLVSFSSESLPATTQTAEVQLVSNADSWAADWLEWVLGFYYLHAEAGYDPLDLYVGGNEQGLLGLPFLGDLLNGLSAEVLANGVKLSSYGTLETHSSSVFAQTTIHFTDSLGLTLGARYQEEDRFLSKQYLTVQAVGLEPHVFNFNAPKRKFDNLSPKVSLNFRPMDDVLTYVSWAKGFKSGTFNSVAIYTPPTYVKPETVTSYEFGFKTEFFGGNVRLNGAVFESKTRNVQAMYISLTNGGAITFENAGAARSRGIEMDSLLVPMPDWNPGLVVVAGVSAIDAKYTDYVDGSGYSPQTGIFVRNQDFTGNKVARSPDFTGNLGFVQSVDLASGTLEVGADIYYNDGFFYTAINDPKASQDAYSVLNARISYLYNPWQLRLTLFGENLDDETYSVGHLSQDFGKSYYLGAPRTYGLRVKWEL